VTDSLEAGQAIGAAMQEAFQEAGLSSTVNVALVDAAGARQL